MLVIDFSQVVISNAQVQLGKELKSPKPEVKNLIKHLFFSQLLRYKKMFPKSGSVIIACDGRKYWRKEFFPYYKGHRKLINDSDGFDWEFLYNCMDELKEDIKLNFPYKLIQADRAEADDIVAVLAKYSQTNELISDGLFDGEPQEFAIISTDNDFGQLQKYKNVKQYAPMLKKMIKNPKPLEYVIEHICEGDAGDNVPNIVTADQWAIDRTNGVKVRAKSFMKERQHSFNTHGIDACLNDLERANWVRNRTLVDFDYIPSDVEKLILDTYNTTEVKGSKTKIMNYLMANRMKLLMESLGDF
jgi:hypothetical protein